MAAKQCFPRHGLQTWQWKIGCPFSEYVRNLNASGTIDFARTHPVSLAVDQALTELRESEQGGILEKDSWQENMVHLIFFWLFRAAMSSFF